MNITTRQPEIYEVLELVAKATSKKARIEVLRTNDTTALRDLIRVAMDPALEWTVPDTPPPYKPSPENAHARTLLKENTKFGLFIKGGPGDKINKPKRERIFLQMLEAIHPKDALLVVGAVSKKQLGPGMTRSVIAGAFPELEIGK
jgi:hypothetical protein